jgi:hypothetical protein
VVSATDSNDRKSRLESLVLIKLTPHLSSRGYVDPLFQTHYFSENLVAPGIELGISDSVARNSDHRGDPIEHNKEDLI